MPARRSFVAGLAAAAPLLLGPAAAGAAPAANRCVGIGSGHFHLKPTSLHRVLVHDRNGQLIAPGEAHGVARVSEPGPAAEWELRRARGGRWTLRAGSTGAYLALERPSGRLTTSARPRRLRLARARTCVRFPEAALGVVRRRSRPEPRERLWGIADPHVHVTASLRAGGQVIAGEPFGRFGIAEALGRDEEVHGPGGNLDFTGNLLRSGTPTGGHHPDGWPTFTAWPTRDTFTHQQVYWRWLQRAWLGGLRLIVAQTVEDEPLCRIEPFKSHSCDEMATVELEVARLRALQDYVDGHAGGRGRGWFRLVFSPREARRVIARGRLAVLIGAETSNPFGCSQFRGAPACDRAQIDREVDRMHELGVRSMFVAHWVDNALGGAALEGGDKGLFIAAMQLTYTGEPFSTGPCPLPGQGEEPQPAPPEPFGPGKQCNTRGLTELGEYAVRRMMDRGMLIEVDHLSERARARVLEIAAERRYPLVSSHTGTGGPWHESELRRLYGVGGFASATLDSTDRLPGKVLALQALQPRRAGIGLSTDTGGFAALPGPPAEPLAYPFASVDGRLRFERQRTGSRTFDLNHDGVAHYGLLPDHLAAVARRPDGRRALSLLSGSARAYVRMWRRAFSSAR